MRTSHYAALATAAFLLASTATSALAGEITGTGETTPLQGLSSCKYSGLNSGDAPFFEQTQTYGQLVRLGIADLFGGPKVYNPNTSYLFPPYEGCNAHVSPATRGSVDLNSGE